MAVKTPKSRYYFVKDVFSKLEEVPKDKLLLFMKQYVKKDKDFVFHLSSFLAGSVDTEESIHLVILKHYYKIILNQRSRKNNKTVKKLFGFIADFTLQIEDQIVLGNYRAAVDIWLCSFQYSSKALDKLDDPQFYMETHLKLYDLLLELIDVIKAAELKEHLFGELAELASSFYYHPYDREKNLFSILQNISVYGQNDLAQMWDKYENSRYQLSKSLIGVFLVEVALDKGYDQLPLDKVMMVIKEHREDVYFLQCMLSLSRRIPLPIEVMAFYRRIYPKVMSMDIRSLLFRICVEGGSLEDNSDFITQHLSLQFSEKGLVFLKERYGRAWDKFVRKLANEESITQQVRRILIVRLMMDQDYSFDQVVSKVEEYFSLDLLFVFLDDLMDMNEERMNEVIWSKTKERMETTVGNEATVWFHDLVHKLQKRGYHSLASDMTSRVHEQFGHRKSVSQAFF